MLVFLLLFMPTTACLFWFLQNIFIARRTSTFGIFQFLLLAVGVFVLADSLYAAPGVPPQTLAHARLLEIVTAPCLIPIVWLYLHKLKYNKRFVSVQYFWLVIPVFFLSTGALLHELAGATAISEFMTEFYRDGAEAALKHKGDAVYIYYVFTVIVYRIIMAAEVLCSVGYMVRYMRKEKMSIRDLYNFRKKGAHCSVLEIQLYSLILPATIAIAKTAMNITFTKSHVWISLILAALITLCIFNISFIALFGARRKITLENMRHVMVYNYNDKIKSIIVEFTLDDLLEEAEEEGLRRLQEKIGETLPEKDEGETNSPAITEQLFATMAGTWDEDSLLSRFQNLMVKDKLFLQPGISLVEIADKLHTNKTYVSKLVNNTYNMGFPELLNTLRIDYAEQYILNHRDAKQNEIAEACGFLSASSFNSIFKKVTGMTPKVWIAGIDNKEHHKNA